MRWGALKKLSVLAALTVSSSFNNWPTELSPRRRATLYGLESGHAYILSSLS
jgi:hypothetical protein